MVNYVRDKICGAQVANTESYISAKDTAANTVLSKKTQNVRWYKRLTCIRRIKIGFFLDIKLFLHTFSRP